jgi:hypothetical protein
LPRNGGGIYSKGSPSVVTGTTIQSAAYNTTIDDLVTDANAARPISAGGTGAANAANARTNLGISATNTPFTPAGNIAATNVQAALAEVDTEKAALAGATFTGGISGTTGTFSGVVSGAAATADGHLLNRLAADTRFGNYRPEAFGALGNGTGDDGPAILAAAAANGGYVEGKPGATYRTSGQIVLPAPFRFNLNGATLRPAYQGTSYALYRQVSDGLANTVTAHIAGSRSVTVSAAVTDIVAGDWIIFETTSYSGRWPSYHRRVTSITGAGTILNFHTLIPQALPANTTVRKWLGSGDLQITNGTIDCVEITDAGGNALGVLYADGYENLLIEGIKIENYNLNAGSDDYIFAIKRARNAIIENCVVENGSGERGVISTFDCGTVIDRNMYFDGDGFGIAHVNAENARTENLTARGRWVFGGSSTSIRAWRPIGCGTVELSGADITGYDSGVKNEDNISFTAERLKIRNCNVGVNISHQNPGPQWGDVTIRDALIEDCVAHGIYDVEVDCENHVYRDITIRRTGDHGVNMAGLRRFLAGIRVYDWPSAKHPIVFSTLSAVVPTGSMRDVLTHTTTTAGRLAIQIPVAATGLLLDTSSIVCNIAGASGGGFENRPPRVYEVSPGGIELGRATVNMNSTADQALNLTIPAGYTRYRFLSIIVTNQGAVNHSSAVGGIYTAASKGGTAIVANTQTYTAMTTDNTNVNVTISTAGVQIMNDTSLFFSLTTASGAAGNALVQVFGFPVP